MQFCSIEKFVEDAVYANHKSTFRFIKRMKLSESISLVDGTMANSYVVNIRDKVILIDSGMRSSSKKIIKYFQSAQQRPDIVLITHCHPDHIGGLLDIEEEFHPRICVPDIELQIALGEDKMPERGGFGSMISRLVKARPVKSATKVSELKLLGLENVDTNGHTPGSTSYYFEGLKAIFVGDAVFEKNGKYEFNRSFTLDGKLAEDSIKRILVFHGVTAYPGHGDSFLIP